MRGQDSLEGGWSPRVPCDLSLLRAGCIIVGVPFDDFCKRCQTCPLVRERRPHHILISD